MEDVDDVLFKRLSFLRDELDFLRAERDRVASFETYRTDQQLKRAVERSLHIAVETCLDMGRRVIALEVFR